MFGEDEVDVPPEPVDPLAPAYPPRLRMLGIEGDVEARVTIWADGSAGRAELLSSSHDDFTLAARDALRTARFRPALRQGRPVAATLTLRFRFRLDE